MSERLRNLFYEQLQAESDGELVSVIRCKDCRHWYGDGYCNKWDNGPGHPEVWENDFCSMGERREDE